MQTKDESRLLDRLEQTIDYHFNDRQLALKAITHPSAVREHNRNDSYERLEFLGDSVLGAIIAKEAYLRYPHLDEGGLTRLKIAIVSGSSLSDVASSIGLEDLIIFGSSELGTLGRGLSSALENCLEALIGAIYLDSGTEVATKWVLRTVGSLLSVDLASGSANPKSALQELLQQRHVTPTYKLLETSGPPHDRMFSVCVLADDKIIGHGNGHSKKDAEVQAAQQALDAIKRTNAVE